jgi:hypothetical protein
VAFSFSPDCRKQSTLFQFVLELEKVGLSRPRQLGAERGWALDELTIGAFGP